MLRVRMFDIAAILLLPPLICQLSNCSASINGGFPGKAAVKKVIVRPSLDYPPSCGFSFFRAIILIKIYAPYENKPMMAVINCRSSALRLLY